ncbi:beta-glucosidase 18 isoform X1 [Beta vulgaris subsp. vulgaris]|uniref:beta-glucosidase 18 isoform X1 n=1 Tax=Beta vulgaris subsp. vulgaris TaxID=3555 RepID=UPI0020370D5A|nr:beta-glucosidase 18 isoform X1 [Beta vulgaris subsp. vulgaris]
MQPKALLIFFIFFSLLISIHSKYIHEVEDKEEVVIKRSMFPDNFIFGVGTSAYQIEGAYLEDGKSLSNWDVFTHVPGNIESGENGDVADDHYHHYMEDIQKLEYLGVNAYRFSISWTRILPRGRFGETNPSGVLFYNNIIDNVLLKGIQPFVTIHHNDIPQELEDRYGSWLSSEIQEDFVLFAKTCFENFGDRVKYWVTINEPNINAILAYMEGAFPPRRCSAPFGNCSVGNSNMEPLIVAHNMLISHAKAVKVYRDQFQPKQGGSIGIVVHAFHYERYTDDEWGFQAVERAYAFNLAWLIDPLIYGDYPAIMRKYIGKELPNFSIEEVKLVKGSVDFVGLNHYTSFYAIDCLHHSTDCTPSEHRPVKGFTARTGSRDGIPIGDEMGMFGFHVVPHGMEKLLNYINMRYPNLSIYITENGYCPPYYQVGTQMLSDFKRIKYHEAYLAALSKAMREGAKVKGYFAWSFMDNFEWLQGYNISFGLYFVDRKTMERIPRLSAKWYSEFIANGEISIISSF